MSNLCSGLFTQPIVNDPYSMKDMPPLQWLRTFEASARHLSFTAAATELNVTQSAVSQQIKLLENYLGQSLFVRRARSLQLTNSARLYLPDVQTAISQLRKSTELHFGKADSKTLTIRSNWAFSVFWLSPRLGDFLKQHPGLSVNIIPALWEADYHDKSDVVQIRFGKPAPDEDCILLTQQIYHYPVCSPELASNINSLEDLEQAVKIDVMGFSGQWEDFLRKNFLCENNMHQKPNHSSSSYISTPTFILAVEMARSSLGVALTHDLIVQNLINSGQLTKVGNVQIPIAENYYLIHDKQHASPIEKEFCDWLIEAISA
jgi:LysR family glycine cleavage system transcriptional activator